MTLNEAIDRLIELREESTLNGEEKVYINYGNYIVAEVEDIKLNKDILVDELITTIEIEAGIVK